MASYCTTEIRGGRTLTIVSRGEHSRMHGVYFEVQERDESGAFVQVVGTFETLDEAESCVARTSDIRWNL